MLRPCRNIRPQCAPEHEHGRLIFCAHVSVCSQLRENLCVPKRDLEKTRSNYSRASDINLTERGRRLLRLHLSREYFVYNKLLSMSHQTEKAAPDNADEGPDLPTEALGSSRETEDGAPQMKIEKGKVHPFCEVGARSSAQNVPDSSLFTSSFPGRLG